jgi:cupin 2 domain-containing protein
MGETTIPDGNIFANLNINFEKEIFENIVQQKNVKIGRIISSGQATPPGEWYDQKQDEWAILIQGEADLLLEGDDKPMKLKAGDYIFIPAHRKHRVEMTKEGEASIWIAVHIY